MILEGGNQYYYDHNKRLHSNNLWLTQAIEKLEKYLSDQINAAAQQQQINQNINKNSTAAHPACIEQHIENGFSSISSVNTKDLTKITNFDSTQVSEVSPPENPGLKINETQEFSMLDETQIQNHLVANEGDSTQPSFSDIRDPTVPNLQINDSDIHAMSEKYRTEIQENLLENKLKSQAKQISVDQTVSRTDSNEKSSSSASNHLTKSSSSSSKNKLGLSLDLSNIKWSSSSGNSKNASGNSKNSTATTVKLNVANNSTLEKIKEIETENESPDIDSILSSESSDQVKLESMIPPAHPASKSTGRKTVKPQLYNPYGSMPSSVNQSQLSQLSQDLTAMFGQPETASTFAETPSCYGSAEPSPEELEMEKAKYGLKLADESQISQINYFNFENVGY